jgi:hypothetical protein
MEKEELGLDDTPAKAHLVRACVRFLFLLGVWGGLLFWAAGTPSWTRGWVHVGLWIVTGATNLVILLRTNPDVVAARLNRQQVFAKFEKVMLPLFVPVALAIPVVAGLDAVRYTWTFLPLRAMWPGVFVHAAGDAFMLWAMIVNPYLAPQEPGLPGGSRGLKSKMRLGVPTARSAWIAGLAALLFTVDDAYDLGMVTPSERCWP